MLYTKKKEVEKVPLYKELRWKAVYNRGPQTLGCIIITYRIYESTGGWVSTPTVSDLFLGERGLETF